MDITHIMHHEFQRPQSVCRWRVFLAKDGFIALYSINNALAFTTAVTFRVISSCIKGNTHSMADQPRLSALDLICPGGDVCQTARPFQSQ
ncbi:hypothetical protein D9M71_765600 [compost metagenome]